ncbi:hypothetical protein BO71DRAFT_410357 [Aspergillus ellipticus CBS 707.79]|uniref:Uncharacterized protein n=1 Tax=Aspergillus ellipticus CBS 707.79 TaxID=1448320 RepID=A0A319DYF3_9EURO|nr:hypothetical protein BO71DRAFT_410357 [Aspergillus ellipticus CBS 707.79]
MDSKDQSRDVNRRRQAWSFSLSIRPAASRRARSVTPASLRDHTTQPDHRTSTPPTCEESVHYPIFNPRNPRHNPSVASSAWPQDDYYVSQPPNFERSLRRMQNLPRRSLRRAHSGFLAFTSGMRRRPIPAHRSHNDDIPSIWSSTDSAKDSSDQQGTLYSSTVSEASTEEDVDFGTDLQRISCKYPPQPDANMDRYLQSLPSLFAWDDGVLSGSTAGPSHRREALAPTANGRSARSSNTGATEAGSHEMALRQIRANSGDGSADGIAPVNESSQQFPSLSGSYVSLSAGSENEGGLAPSHSGVNLQLPDTRDDVAKSTTGSSSSSGPPLVPTIEVTNCQSVMVTASRDNRASESPRGADNELAMNSLELYERLELDEGQSGEHNMESQASAYVSGSHENPSRADASISRPRETPLPENPESHNSGVSENANEGSYDSTQAQTGGNCTSTRCNDSTEDTPFGTDGAADDPNEDMDAASALDSSSSNEDMTLLLALRDEYFLVDKSNDLRPDRGNNATKAERSFSGDGGLYSGPGLDRNLSNRPQEIPEMIGPRTPHPVRSFPVERDASDSTDEYLVTYPVSQRHYFS